MTIHRALLTIAVALPGWACRPAGDPLAPAPGQDAPVLLRYDLSEGASRHGRFRFYEIARHPDGESTFLLEFDADLVLEARGDVGTRQARVTIANAVADQRLHWKKVPRQIDASSVDALERTILSFELSDRGVARDRTIVPEGLSDEARLLVGKAGAAVQLGLVELPEAPVSKGDRWKLDPDDPLADRQGRLVRIVGDDASEPAAELRIRGTLRQTVSDSLTIESGINTMASFSIDDGWPTRIEQKIEGPIPGEGPFSIEVEARWSSATPTMPE
jgi:hypothetical protein